MGWPKLEGKWDQWNGSCEHERVRFVRTEQWQTTAKAYGLVGRSDDREGVRGSSEGTVYKKLAGVLMAEVERLRKELAEARTEK